MKCSDAGLDLIKRHEGLRLSAYKPTPDDVWTIGYGHTKGVKEGDICTEEQADAYLREDVVAAEKCVSNSVSAEITQNEFDALCSFVFNLGCAALRNSTLLRKLNGGEDGVSDEFLKWDHQAGHVLAGLTKRRQEEKQLFDTENA